MVISDSVGEILACLSLSKSFNSQPIIVDWALWITLEFCAKLALQNVHLEGDAQMVIKAI